MTELNVLLCSTGRRPYLVDWFKQALTVNGVEGYIVVADADEHCASRSTADRFVRAPRVWSNGYVEWLIKILQDERIGLALSFNDFELSAWSRSNLAQEAGGILVHLDAKYQELVEDKLLMAHELNAHGVQTPATVSGATAVDMPETIADWGDHFIIKHRYGSGSVGLVRGVRADLTNLVLSSASIARDRFGQPAESVEAGLDALVVQPLISGTEYGIDVVCDLKRKYVTTFARKKLAMRAGETDQAVSVSGAQFDELGRHLAACVPHAGIMDGDVIIDDDDQLWLIDLNPRFGGGYPFSHMAGANLPAAYVAWALERAPRFDWLSP